MSKKPSKISLTVDGYDPIARRFPTRNVVRDYEKLQGISHPADLIGRIPRSLDTRLISIENSSCRPVAIGISINISEVPPAILLLHPLQTKYLGVNPMGEADQFIHILNPKTGAPVGDPEIIARNANAFVLRDGETKWWVSKMSRPGFHAG